MRVCSQSFRFKGGITLKILGMKTHGVTASLTDKELRMILEEFTSEKHRIRPNKQIKLERGNHEKN